MQEQDKINKYELYLVDTETTGLDPECDIVEISILKFSTSEINTWHLKALNESAIEPGALKINGHKLEDITHKTQHGKDKYKEPSDVIVEIENWILTDDLENDNRVLVAHNVVFDKTMMQGLWSKCNSKDTFPFGRRTLDTSSLEFFMDLCSPSANMAKGYSLSNLCKKYGVKNEKAHTAEADTKTMYEVLLKQIDTFKKALQSTKE